MKIKCSILILFSLLAVFVYAAEDPDVGDEKARVIRVLGQPQGTMQNLDKEILYYKRGLVNLELGKVDQVDLFTEAELAEIKRQKAYRIELKRLEEEAEKEERMAKGREELNRILSDEKFESRPPSVRLHVWDMFKERYPDNPVDELSYQRAQGEYQEAQAKEAVVRQQQLEEEVARIEDPGPRPNISSKRIKKMKRAGTWKWSKEKTPDL